MPGIHEKRKDNILHKNRTNKKKRQIQLFGAEIYLIVEGKSLI